MRALLSLASSFVVASAAQAAPLAGVESHAQTRVTEPVHVTGGAIVGSETANVRTFLGVPYAAPPVGPLRWRAPQPVRPWNGVKAARAFSPVCNQTADWVKGPRSEDCLYLNIWAPVQAKNLPVMVWIHGGALVAGSGSEPGYDGARLTRQGVIVVTLNYRLGIFGFFAHPELSAETPGKGSGNQGIQDQIAALRWVRDNISAFGGDPRRVTIMGNSSGSESVAILVASPLAKGLFQRAIGESGNDAMPLDSSEDVQFDRATAEAEGEKLARAVGAARLSDLRTLDADRLMRQPWSPPGATVDGYVLRKDLTTTYRHHRQNDVPILVGWSADEGKDLAPEILATSEFTAKNHRELIKRLLGHEPSPAVLAAYPAGTDAQARESINQITTDWWGWRMWRWASLQAESGGSKSYLYYFVHSPTEPLTHCNYGCRAGHGAEIRYVFDHLDQDPRAWSEEDRQLARKLVGYWTNFAKTGDPNGPGLPSWSAFDGASPTILRIGNETEIEQRGAIPGFEGFAAPSPTTR